MTNTDTASTGFIITNPNRRLLALVSLKARLRLEIATGMSSSSRMGLIAAARGWGYEGPNRKQKCLDWVLAELEANTEPLSH